MTMKKIEEESAVRTEREISLKGFDCAIVFVDDDIRLHIPHPSMVENDAEAPAHLQLAVATFAYMIRHPEQLAKFYALTVQPEMDEIAMRRDS
jgi:hypothetical protein